SQSQYDSAVPSSLSYSSCAKKNDNTIAELFCWHMCKVVIINVLKIYEDLVKTDLLVSASNVIENRKPSLACASLIEDVEGFDGLELFFLVHVVLHHNLLKISAGHVDGTPSGI
ncbi:hypothetical protein C0J52_09276, partial [Blattella germanica]